MAESNDTNALEVTVTELSGKLKRAVEDTFGHVRVRGEISGYRGPHSSGHSYFSLKDDRARLEAVIWRGVAGKLKHLPEEGLEVIASGKLTTYPGSSKYQIVIDNLEPAGAGALMALLEERKRKLAAEGLFAEEAKRPLPFMPRTIGVITSPTGAVIRDVLHRIKDRYPVHVIVWPVRVQGETSGREVANGIHRFNKLPEGGPIPRPDLLIVARGGGSLEDLWGFNDEIVVRATAASTIPLISAVGHETDWTLIDQAADFRAPTPTAAAEKAVPVKADLEAYLADLSARLRGASVRYLDNKRSQARATARAMPSLDNLLAVPRQIFDDRSGRLRRSLERRVEIAASSNRAIGGKLSPHLLANSVNHAQQREANLRQRFTSAFGRQRERRSDRLDRTLRLYASLNYKSVLARGFAVVRDESNAPISDLASQVAGSTVQIETQSITRDAVLGGTAATPKPRAKKPARKPPSKPAGQGDLF
jgi:exodeoxyribonuclease VII large subunit